ncbi:DNA (cytosine-5-)-methyltransferase [Chitinophaga barathri]|uniref:Cytosine-specific methyltransferase n=1 Tax=Chitinophaga barathri TaxID=1647451 RepID=A0A3N4N6Q8_9BACT|nr:DNA (cytosine-5-)-methyltransferase [Chitinophaga barathri]
MRHGSLFSGIGGFDLAAHWMGWQNMFHCEINEFCNNVLQHYWPQSVSIKNIIGYDWKKWKKKIDVLSGGFPCQPFSLAGKRLGKNDERHLWPAMLEAIRAIRPRWVVAENVRGLVSWSEGLVFEEVQADLEAEGYQVLASVLPAAGVGAPHRRERVFLVAYSGDQSWKPTPEQRREECRREWEKIWGRPPATAPVRNAAYTNSQQRPEGRYKPQGSAAAEQHPGALHAWPPRDAWKDFPTQSPLCCSYDELSGRLDGIAFSRWRN